MKYVRRNELSDDFYTAIVGNIISQIVQIHNRYMNYNLCCQIINIISNFDCLNPFSLSLLWSKTFTPWRACIIFRILPNCFEWRKAFNISWYWNNLYTSKKLAYMVVLSFSVWYPNMAYKLYELSILFVENYLNLCTLLI